MMCLLSCGRTTRRRLFWKRRSAMEIEGRGMLVQNSLVFIKCALKKASAWSWLYERHYNVASRRGKAQKSLSVDEILEIPSFSRIFKKQKKTRVQRFSNVL